MADAGLTKRLRQHSQRAGVMVGFSMALTISLLVGGFVVIYGWSGQFFSDFIPADATATPTAEAGATRAPAPTARAAAGSAEQTPTAVATEPPAEAGPTAPPSFQPTHRIAGTNRINFRSGPGTDSEIITVLTPGTPLQFLNEVDDSSGAPWMKFKIEEGNEGWVREWDVETVAPGA